MHRPFLAAGLLLAGCGSDAELIRYTVEVTITENAGLDPQSAGSILELPPCDNAEVFDQTLRVYDGWDPGAVAAYTFRYTGFDLSGGGENAMTVFVGEGETYRVPAALKPDLFLYEVDDRGRMIELDKEIANVRRKRTVEATYTLGEGAGLPVDEVHELARERDEVLFVEQGRDNCEVTQF